MFENLRGQVEAQSAKLEVLGVATTGYAKDILKDVLNADVALVETVAHTESALKFYDDPHVIVDVGGQDIKIIILHNGRVKDFKLNTQCSAGNGYFLQSTAEGFGLGVEQYADLAFSAQSMPVFGYGCAVFMQSDIVNFQRQGWRAEEILAGLAAVLPKNVFLYVASIPNLAALGTRFVLQGGTQNNIAVVKAEVDFITQQLPGRRQEAGDHRSRILRRIGSHWRCSRVSCACGETASRPPSSAWMPSARSNTAPRATKLHAAISARTIACAPSSTSAPRPRTT